ncbi:hypothetical protein ElyMa_000117200 [Elysia marginata]|uniref:BESS domain-containing protein n=1 Tax=Elysia marginata TaxID=1093978 RepID=A0AAV4EM65_9GAST|nr:hypothetical protein ElyMa_000117200 [Elysia marginata]
MTVLRTLPNLRKLDNIVVTEDEVHQAGTEGDLMPVPEDFSSSSLFSLEVLKGKASISPPNSARSVDSTKSMAESVVASVGSSVENSIGNSVCVSGSDGCWALPRRKRQQKKREEMMRSSGGDEGGGSARSGEDSSGPGEDKGSNQVSCSSDSHPEEDNDVDAICKSESGDKNLKNVANGGKGTQAGDGAFKTSTLQNRDITVSPTRSSANSDVNKSSEELKAWNEMNGGKCSDKGNDDKASPRDSKASSDTEETSSSPLGTNPEYLPVTDCNGSVNVLRISELADTGLSEPSPSSNNTLIHSGEVPTANDKNNSNNNNNNGKSICSGSSVRDEINDINLNEIDDGKSSVSNDINSAPVLAKPSISSPVKLNEHSLLDQIRLDDSLDVLDSATEENSPAQQEVVTSIDLEHLQVKIDQAVVPPANQDQSRQADSPKQQTEYKSQVGDAAFNQNCKPKPPVPSKPKATSVNMDEHNRMRLELGLKPMNNSKSSTSSVKTGVLETKRSNVLQAVLCLLKELDKESLDIVGAAVKSRLEDFE